MTDTELNTLADLIDMAITSDDPRIKSALSKLLTLTALIGKTPETGVLTELITDQRDLRSRVAYLERTSSDAYRRERFEREMMHEWTGNRAMLDATTARPTIKLSEKDRRTIWKT